jgi:hypothetical protein
MKTTADHAVSFLKLHRISEQDGQIGVEPRLDELPLSDYNNLGSPK